MNRKLLWAGTALLTTTLVMPFASRPVLAKQSTQSKASLQVNTPTNRTVAANNMGLAPNNLRIARVQPHEIQGRMAATLLVRNIPVLTFIGSSSASSNDVRQLNAPIFQATAAAAQINQMNLDHVDASTIQAVWESSSDSHKAVKAAPAGRYVIKIKNTELVEINSSTRLPDTISDPAKDALQASNRLRALIGNAPALDEIAGKKVKLPEDKFLAQLSLGPLQIKYSYGGLASWYSFHDNGVQTASGQPYNENELTAAHKDLPFGTKVQVTNLQNGQTVVVKITDRGPYVEGRILDLSTAAAGLIGMIDHGVVPVQLDILSQSAPVAMKPKNKREE